VTEPSAPVVLDPAGYFVIIPRSDKKILCVEHYAYDNTLLRNIEGANVRAVYLTIIQNGWVSELSHAAYLGKELAKAELALTQNLPYVQDGA
jgi:tetrahydromethanopterin S-methyltransferase subunit A